MLKGMIPKYERKVGDLLNSVKEGSADPTRRLKLRSILGTAHVGTGAFGAATAGQAQPSPKVPRKQIPPQIRWSR